MTSIRTRLAQLRRIRPAGVKVRSAFAAAAVVCAAVGFTGAGMIYAAKQTLTGNVTDSAAQRLGEVAAAIQSGDPVALEQTLRPSAGEQTAVQVVNPAGQVVAASQVLAGQPPMSTLRPPAGRTAWQEKYLPTAGKDDRFRIAATTVATGAGNRTVLVAQSLRPVNETLELLSSATAVAVPLLALIVGAATFYFVGRSLHPVEAIRGRVAGITGRDLRARVPVPAARDEVAALADTMNAMLDRLQAASQAQRRFVADASHELRSPLATLQVGLEVMTPQSATAGQIERLRGETERIARLVNDLLLLARADEHELRPRRTDVDLDDVAYRQRQRLRGRRPDLSVEANVAPVRVNGDPHQLDRAVANLCENAGRHARSRVAITVRADGTSAILTVDDDGPGISRADRERIFDRFVRLDDSRARQDGGSGLGLAISREIVQGHGGTVHAAASPLGGARLELRLPLPDGSETW